MLYFFKRNYALLLVIYLYSFGLFFSVTFIPSILITKYNFSESFISTSSLVLAFSIFAASLFTKEMLKFKINYFKVMRIMFSVVMIDVSVFFILLSTGYLEQYKITYLILRAIEGFSSGVAMAIGAHLLSSKMLLLDNRVEVSSVQSTMNYGIKTISPIIGGIFIVAYGYECPIVVTIVFYTLTLIVLWLIEARMLLRYHRYINKNIVKQECKFHIKNIKVLGFVPNLRVRKKNPFINHFYIFLFAQNIYRPFYDVFLLTVLITKLSVGYAAAGVMFSALSLGQAAQYLSTLLLNFLEKRMKNYLFFTLTLIINTPLAMLLSFLIYQLNTDQKIIGIENLVLTGLIIGVGLGRSLYSTTSEYYNFMIIDIDKKHISDHNGNKNFISDSGNWIGYLITIALLSVGYVLLFYVMLLVVFLSISSSAISKGKCLKTKNIDILPIAKARGF